MKTGKMIGGKCRKNCARINTESGGIDWYGAAWYILPLIGMVVWGLLSVGPNMWYDELFSASLVTNSFKDMIRITAIDVHSPFYYTGLKLFYYMFGQQYWALKCFSLLFILGYLGLGMFYVKKFWGLKISVWFLFFSVTMPAFTVQAGNVRMYAMALFFVTLTGLAAYDVYSGSTGKKWVLFCISSICSVYCHTFTMLMMVYIYLMFLIVLLAKREYKKIRNLVCCGLTVSAAYAPWLAVTVYQMYTRMRDNSGTLAEASRPTIYTFMDYCKEWFSALETPIGFVVFAGMGMWLFLGYYAVSHIRETRDFALSIGMLAMGFTALTGALVSIYVNPCFLGRYIFPGFGFMALFYAAGMKKLAACGGRRSAAAVAGLAIVCFLLQYQSELRLEYDPGLRIYEKFVEEKVEEGDVIVVSQGHTAMLSFYSPEVPFLIYGYRPAKLPFLNLDVFYDWDLLPGEGNVWYLCFLTETPAVETYEKVTDFHYMYYDFSIYQLECNREN